MINPRLLALAFIAVASLSHAQWNMYTHPGYQSIFSVTTSPGAIYMVAYPNGVIKSINGGLDWNPVNNGLPAGTAVESVYYNGTYLFAGTHSGVYRSTDFGATWNLANTGLPTSSTTNFANKFYTYGTTTFAIYSGQVGPGTGGVWRTTDNGANWFSGNGGLSSNMTVYQLVDVNSRIWAATSTGLSFSENLGVGWTNDPASNFACYAVQGNASRMVVISSFGYRYRNFAGGSWGAWTTGTGAPANPTGGELILYDGKYWAITGGSPGNVLRSVDNGASWSNYNTGIMGADVITQYEFHAGGSTLYLGTLTHLYWHAGSTTGAEEQVATELSHPYPTLFTDRFSIDLSQVPPGGDLVLLDALGREVERRTNLPSALIHMERGTLPTGTYRVLLIDQSRGQRLLLGAVVAQ